MSSNRVIIVILIIFTVVGIIGQFANYQTTALVYDTGDDIVVKEEGGGLAGFIGKIPVIGSIVTAGRTAIQNTELASSLFFLTDILTFSVPSSVVPPWISVIFNFMAFILCVAVLRVVLGTLAGGAG